MATKLSDYALIGNSRAGALVSSNGSIDWCCLPEFDSPSIFAALLDTDSGGHFILRPTAEYSSSQSYLTDTNVVETIFDTVQGRARIVDAFTVMDEATKRLSPFPDHEILRVVEGISGTVHFKMEFAPRTFYGKELPHLKDYKKLGVHFAWKENNYVLLSTLEPEQQRINVEDAKVRAEFSVKPGARVIFSFSCSNQSPAILPELKITGWQRMQRTINFWKKWISQCQYDGLYKKQVRRSALTLKLLTHAPSGAIIAAPTTSLPEKVGGQRNWDYRYCWLRDASFTLRALMKLGFKEEAHAYMHWILHATQLTQPKLQVVYSVFGHASLKEKTLDWLEGFKSSKPVRIGNGADGQFQLDVYGEVIDAFYTYSKLVTSIDRDFKKFVLGLGESIYKLWNKPDNGIWEVRSSYTHHTHSKVMAWVGLDRLIKLSKKFYWKEAPMDKYAHIASCLQKEIEELGYNHELASYTSEYSGNTLDASLLTLPLVGYCDPSSKRMLSTTQQIIKHLSKNNLLYRYKNIDDGLAGDEGTFGICNFWLAENLAKSGEQEKAIEVFETMLSHAGSTGLLSEEIDPDSYEPLGNYPQGFSHIGLINAALSINEVYRKKI
jgi:GH15 family glucan-1,4-alpha-glucosidase